MKAVIVISDEAGNTWEHELTLVSRRKVSKIGATRSRPTQRTPKAEKPRSLHQAEMDFSLPVRPFIKRYAKGASGPRKFAILVARLASGNTKVEVPFKDIEKQWNRMTQLMGGRFNPAHASRAKDNGWVDSPKHGMYKLLTGWDGALGG
jgi:hypothetical protein